MIELIHNHPIDFEAIKELYKNNDDLQKAWPGAKFPLCVDEWMNFLNTSSEYASLLFRNNGTIIGHLILKPKEEKQLYICFVILDKKFRGQGLIYEMLKVTEQFAAAKFKYDALWLHVDPNNLPAVKAYEKLGYHLIQMTEAGRYRMSKQLTLDDFKDSSSKVV